VIFLIFQNPAVILPIFYRDFNTSLRMTSNCKDTQTTLPVNNCKVIIAYLQRKTKIHVTGAGLGAVLHLTDKLTETRSVCLFARLSVTYMEFDTKLNQ